MKTAYFAGGCFWCITPIFHLYDGVGKVLSGYSGGDEEHPHSHRKHNGERSAVEYGGGVYGG